jgi:16S rRNA (guanine966-N2)-methyltransferase
MVFDTLMPLFYNDSINNLHILDAFAGTGALGFEALSMIGGHCTFIEMDKQLWKNLKLTADNIGIGDKINHLLGNSLTVIKNVTKTFDLVFLDPPYDDVFLITKLLKKLVSQGNIHTNTYIVIENSIYNHWNFIPPAFRVLKDKIMASTRVMIVQWNGDVESVMDFKSTGGKNRKQQEEEGIVDFSYHPWVPQSEKDAAAEEEYENELYDLFKDDEFNDDYNDDDEWSDGSLEQELLAQLNPVKHKPAYERIDN